MTATPDLGDDEDDNEVDGKEAKIPEGLFMQCSETSVMISELASNTTKTRPFAIYRKYFCCKNENFHWKKFDIFLIFAQNIDSVYTARQF